MRLWYNFKAYHLSLWWRFLICVLIMGPFSSSFGNEYIPLAADYVFMYVDATTTRIYDAKVVVKFLMENIFTRFGMPKLLSLSLSLRALCDF